VTVIIPQRFWMRGDTKEVLEARNEVLYEREFCCETDTGKFKIGKEGVPWNDTPYADTLFHLAASGTDTITAELPFAFELYDMAVLHVRAAGVNTGAATFNGLPLTKHGGVALIAGDIAAAGQELLLAYNEAVPRWELLNPAYTDEHVQDVFAAMIAAGTHIGINFTYDDATNSLSATVAGGGAGYVATSTTSLATAGSGSKAFATQPSLYYTPGARVRATSAGTGEWMEGVVSSYSGTTLTVGMDLNFGTGTHADWNINLAGQRGAVGPSNRFVIPLCDSTQSTKFSATKLALGRKYFDPNDAGWNLSGTSTATLYMLLETTNASFTAAGDLFRQSGAGAPTVVGLVTPTGATTAALLSVDVSAAFRPGANAGIFVARAWLTTADGTQQATCSGAWIEVQP
jgi:hypothetical protein